MKATHINAYSYATDHPRLRHITEPVALARGLHVPRSSLAKRPNRFRGRERGGIARNMELELEELFPKKSDLGLQAVRLLMRLEESGHRKQTELVEELGMKDYAMSRLLARLELHR